MDKKKINPNVEVPLVAKPKAKLSHKTKKTIKTVALKEAWFAS